MALRTQTVDIPFSAGLDTKSDSRAMQPPSLAVCKDVQFDDIGGIQTRPQMQAILDDASNTIADIRKIVTYDDELVAFSKSALWSYGANDGTWTQRAEYLAVKIDEAPRFVSTGEQYDCDRAELDGVTMYCWTEDTPSGTESYIAAIDTVTGAVLLTPEIIDTGALSPKLIATANRITLVYFEKSGGHTINKRDYTPSTVGGAAPATGSVVATNIVAFDLVLDSVSSTKFYMVMSLGGTGYNLYYGTEGANFTYITARAAITVDGPISIAHDDRDADRLVIGFSAGTSILADFLTLAGATVNLDVAVGTASSATVNQITCAFDGVDKFYFFWTAGQTTGTTGFETETNWAQDDTTTGTEASVVKRCGLVSRAFLHDSAIFVWVAFSAVSTGDLVAQLQNSYFLMRSDGLIVAKAVATQGGGFSATDGHLGSVQALGGGGFAWCGILRRIIPLGDQQKGYSAKSIQDVTYSFDSNEARRVAQLGKTLYIAGGVVSQYDGRNVVEVGFHTFPWEMTNVPQAGTGLSGTYNWRETYAWTNAKGELDRSTTATIFENGPFSGPNQQARLQGVNLHLTAKTGAAGEVSQEYWRTIAEANPFAPFFLISSKDPASTGDNAYVENDPTAYFSAYCDDDLADADLTKREPSPENGGLTLFNQAPPGASIITVAQDRVILAGIPGHPNRFVYSKLRGDGEVAAFNGVLFGDLPPHGGDITAVAFLNETLIFFKESAIYALGGDGFDNSRGGQNYGPARLIHSDVGAESAEAVGLYSKGILFKSKKGWYLLNHGWQATYIGTGAAEWDGETVLSVEATENQNQVRCVTTARTIVWDHLVGQWFEWGIGTVDATIFRGSYHVVGSDLASVESQALTYSGAGDLPQLDVETSWIKFAGFQGYKRCRRFYVLGEYRGASDLRIRVAYDYDESDSGGVVWTDDKTWTISPTTIGGVLQVEHRPSKQKCQAIKIRITAQAVGAATAPITEAFDLTGLSFRFGVKGTGYKGLPAAQKQ